MPTSADDQLADAVVAEAVVAYYRGVESTLLNHLRGRRVEGFGRDTDTGAETEGQLEAEADATAPASAGPDQDRDRDQTGFSGASRHQAVDLHIADLEDLDEAIRSGVTYFRLPGLTGRGLVTLLIRPGTGSGIDTAATAALALATSMSRDGIAATAMTDGADGLYLVGFGVGPVEPSAGAARYASRLAELAPEIATTDASDFEGRALIQPLPRRGGRAVPAPYSLVTATGGRGVAVPLTMDEVAAASAGMPLEIGPADVADRLASYGDLAAALGEATALPA